MNNIFAIGDIHGGLRALQQVVERAPVQENDMLVFMGDYVDGWSQSYQVIEYLIELNQKQNCIFLKGNHDAWAESWLATGAINSTWVEHGGKETIDSYAGITGEKREQHLQFYKSLQLYFIDAFGRCYVHGGYTSKRGPAFETIPEVLMLDRTLWEAALAAKEMQTTSLFYPRRLNSFKEIFIGHTPTLYLGTDKPVCASSVYNIDTGAAFHGKLTIMNVATKEYWQSDIVRTLYPGEAGRNKE